MRSGKIFFGLSESGNVASADISMLNRHGLVTGATGSGKTVSIRLIAEQVSSMGIPVFMTDIKGDLSGLAAKGQMDDKLQDRFRLLKLSENTAFRSFPVEFWDIFGEEGIPLRLTVTEMGSILMSRILGLNDVQSAVLSIVFRFADENGLLLLDLKDLRALVSEVTENASELSMQYGNISKASSASIIRAVLKLEDQGGNLFFGEPALDINDLLKVNSEGKGVISLLQCKKLLSSPALYSGFTLWLLSELFETLPELGDASEPKMLFIFDEAHLLFDGINPDLLSKIEQIVRLIRSKGVALIFCTQNPADIPDTIISQLALKVQHALRAYTPKEQKAVRAAAEGLRANPGFDTAGTIASLATGEALISSLGPDGIPSVVERVMMYPPLSLLNAIGKNDVEGIYKSSGLFVKYEKLVDSESAYEVLTYKHAKEEADLRNEELAAQGEKEALQKQREYERREKEQYRRMREEERIRERQKNNSIWTRMQRSAVTSVGREVGRQIIRGVLGGLKR